MSWNAYIDIKCNGKICDSHWAEMKKWPEVEHVWSKQGHWDWLVCLRPSVDSLDMVEKIHSQFTCSTLGC